MAGNSSSDLSEVTLAVLAGGEGARMGAAKGGLQIDGRPILRYLLARASWPGPTLLVTAPGREHPPGCEAFDREAVDPVAGLGPLRGVLTALENSTTDELLVTTVDMPGVSAEQLRWLVGRFRLARERSPAPAGMMTDRPAADFSRRHGRQIEPFPAAFHRTASAAVGERLKEGRLSVHGLAAGGAFVVVASPDEWAERCWVNLNRPEDLERFLRERGPMS